MAAQFALPDGSYFCDIKSKKHRSLSQNAFYWSVCVPMIREGLYEVGYATMNNNQQAHEFIKSKFLKKDLVNETTGEVLETIRSTADLTTVEFNQLIEDCQRFGSEYLGINIPDPGEPMLMFAEFDNEVKSTIIE